MCGGPGQDQVSCCLYSRCYQKFAFSALTLLARRQKGHPASKNRVVGCWCGRLFGARCRQLYDLNVNSMTYTLLFYSRLSVSKSFFYVSLDNNFLLFLWRPLSCGGPLGQLSSLPPPLKSGPAQRHGMVDAQCDKLATIELSLQPEA